MSSAPVRRFAHEAMATVFETFIADEDERYAGQAADAAFAEIDRIEQALSRFIESSDIAQINRRAPMTWAPVGVFTLECLQIAERAYRETWGAFDPTIGPLMRLYKTDASPDENALACLLRRVGMDRVEIDPEKLRVRKQVDGLELDLGGVGKGYALDQAAEILREWGVESALLQCGGSTVLALAPPPDELGWRIGVGGTPGTHQGTRTATLSRVALSGSGLEVKGAHILEPATGRPVLGKSNAWALAPSAGLADALSTAFLILPQDRIAEYCRGHVGVCAAFLEAHAEEAVYLGDWGALFVTPEAL